MKFAGFHKKLIYLEKSEMNATIKKFIKEEFQSLFETQCLVQNWMTPGLKTGIVTVLPLHKCIYSSQLKHQLMSGCF